MMAQSAGLHEPEDRLSSETIDRHRAIASIQEELEAVDWYDQRVDATTDAALADVLAHNRDEEKEHAAMTLEWLRRHDPVLDKHLRTYLFTSEPVVLSLELMQRLCRECRLALRSPSRPASKATNMLGWAR